MSKELKHYQFSWTEMSGGFDLVANIKASSEQVARELFKKLLNIKEIGKYTSCMCIEETYTKEHIEKRGSIEAFLRGLPIHKTEY